MEQRRTGCAKESVGRGEIHLCSIVYSSKTCNFRNSDSKNTRLALLRKMAVPLQSAVSALNSEKPTERTAGIDAYRQIFQRDKTLKTLNGDDSTWVQVFQAVFRCVHSEKTACEKKGGIAGATTAQINRLAAASSLLRWLVERACQYFERKTVKPLINHLVQTLDLRGRLLQPIALDYTKSLRTVLARTAHRNSLDPEQWVRIATLCFNVIHSQDLRDDLPTLDSSSWINDANAETSPSESRALGLEDIELMGCLEELMASPYAPFLTEERWGVRVLAQYLQFLETFTIESTAHVPTIAGLNHLLRQLNVNESVIVASFAKRGWRPLVRLWSSKSKVLKEHLVVVFRILLPHVAQGAASNSAASLSSSVPPAQLDQKQLHSMLEYLHRQLSADADNRFNIGPLDLGALRLAVRGASSSSDEVGIFSNRSFGAGRTFSSASALSWATLELSATTAAHLIAIEGSSSAPADLEGLQAVAEPRTEATSSPAASGNVRKHSTRAGAATRAETSTPAPAAPTQRASSSPVKRRKLEGTVPQRSTLEALLHDLLLHSGESQAKAQARRSWNLQVLAFIIGQHGDCLSRTALQAISSQLKTLLKDPDAQIQNWTMIAAAELSLSHSADTLSEQLTQCWTLIIRKINQPVHSRTAALAGMALLQSGQIPNGVLLADLSVIFGELELSAPAFPWDSVCQFFAEALQLCSKDVVLARKPFGSKLLAWLFNTWNPTHGITKGFQSRIRVQEQDVTCTYQLICGVVDTESLLEFSTDSFILPGSPAVEQMLHEQEVAPVVDFLFKARLTTPANQTGGVTQKGEACKTSGLEVTHSNMRAATALEVRIDRYFCETLSLLCDEWAAHEQDVETKMAATATVEQTRRSLDIAVLALLFEGTLHANAVRSNSQLTTLAHRLLQQCAETLGQTNRWSMAERASLLSALEPVTTGPVATPWRGVRHLLNRELVPGERSGLRRDLLDRSPPSSDVSKSEEPQFSAVSLIWRRASTDACDGIVGHLQKCLDIICETPMDDDDDQVEDDANGWGRVRQAKVDSSSLLKPAESLGHDGFATSLSANICVSALIHVHRLAGGAQLLKQINKHLLELLLDGNLTAIDRAGVEVFRAIRDGTLSLTRRSATALMTTLGTEYLPSYQYVKSEHAQMLVLDYLESTMELWLESGKNDTDLAARSEEFCTHFSRSLKKTRGMSWRVRVRTSAFFEALLKATSSRDAWRTNSDEPFSSAKLSELLSCQTGDPDMRVRYEAAFMTAAIVEAAPSHYGDGIFKDACNQMIQQPDKLEVMASRGLTCANAMIVSAAVRTSAFFLLLEPCMLNQITDTHASSLTLYVARLLGYADAQGLFKVFATQLTHGWLSNGYDVTRLPYRVLGYSSMRSCLEHSFESIGSMMAALSVDQPEYLGQLGGLARSIRKSESQGVMECLPSVIAIQLIFAVRERDEGDPPDVTATAALSQMQRNLSAGERALTSNTAIDRTLESALERVIIAVLAQFWDQTEYSTAPFFVILDEIDEPVGKPLLALEDGIDGTHLDTLQHEPALPHAEGMEVYIALVALLNGLKADRRASVTYHVVHNMLSSLWSQRSVNDQQRHFTALNVFLAMNASYIEKCPAILRALVHGGSILIARPNLAFAASGLLKWTFEKILLLEKAPTKLATSVIKLGERIQTLAASPHSEEQQVGSALYSWYDKLLLDLFKAPPFMKHAVDACCAYPRPLPEGLKKSLNAKAFTVHSLSDAIRRNNGTSLGRHLLERLRDALGRLSGREELDDFSRVSIWRLFARLPSIASSGNGAKEIARILADILYALDGVIKTPSATQQQAAAFEDPKAVLLRRFLGKGDQVEGPIQAFVALQIMEVFHEDDLGRTLYAMQTLREAVHTHDKFTACVSNWPDGVVEELGLITDLPSPVMTSQVDQTCNTPASFSDLQISPSKPDEWTCSFAACLCRMLSRDNGSLFYAKIANLVLSMPSLASDCLAALLHAVLAKESETTGDQVRRNASSYLTRVLEDPSANHAVLTSIINAHLHLRQYGSLNEPHDPRATEHWLATDHLLLAKQSVKCKSYTTALLFIELHGEQRTEAPIDQQDLVSNLLFEIYAHVEDPDSFYGVPTRDVRRTVLQRSNHEGDWQKVFRIHSAEYESELASRSAASIADHSAYRGIGASLHQMGYNRMASLVSASGSAGSHLQHEVDYDVAWRTEDWSLPIPSNVEPGTGVSVLSALRALHRDKDAATAAATIEAALSAELQGLMGTGIEAISQARRVSRSLLCVRQAELCHALTQSSSSTSALLDKISEWPTLPRTFDLRDYEAIQTVRQSLLRAVRRRAEGDQIGDMMDSATLSIIGMESRLLLEVAKMARKHDRAQIALNAITSADRLCRDLPQQEICHEVSAEFASVLWAQGEHDVAIQALGEELGRLSNSTSASDKPRRALLLAQMGQWATVARSEQPRTIDESYFQPAISLLPEGKAEAAAVSYKYACFADEQYRSMGDSSEVHQLEVFIAHRQEEIRQNTEEMDRVGPRSGAYRTLNYHRSQADKILKQDLSTLEQHKSSRSFFLMQALKMYANALAYSDKFDDAIVRLTSLWFENSEQDAINEAISGSLAGIPAHKFVPLTHQLSSRLSKVHHGQSPFNASLYSLMSRLCQYHPFHCLYAIYALRKGDVDARPSNTSGKSSSRTSLGTSSPQQARSAAAHALWDECKRTSHHSKRIIELEKGCDAFVQWAELDLKSKMPHLFTGSTIKKGPYRFTPGLNLAIKALPEGEIPVPTAKIPIDATGRYSDIPTIARFSDLFNTAGGLHLPKIIECIAMDGKRYKQLFKSQDDLRQDAVMQQVFTLLNDLLARDRRASQRELCIRTYAVIPLGPQCGLLEFVGNTSPIGEVLISTHEKYRQEGQITPSQARNEIAAVMGKTPREKRAVFQKVCKTMPPAFHHYFLERFKVPSTWFAVRLNYSRSVATTSIIGHVLGLGDRHVSNILLDNVTGEMIHIDFGVAFEQGKLLPIPELVPFRLTRDLVDGMGSSGVEGVFRRCCEETLRVLRENSDVIKTVLEVFKFDPLWAWTSNPVKVLRAQRTSGSGDEPPPPSATPASRSRGTTPAVGIEGRDTASLSAERAIGSVLSKLSSNLSVQYTVNELIRSATDEGNLSAIFHGWQAAL